MKDPWWRAGWSPADITVSREVFDSGDWGPMEGEEGSCGERDGGLGGVEGRGTGGFSLRGTAGESLEGSVHGEPCCRCLIDW